MKAFPLAASLLPRRSSLATPIRILYAFSMSAPRPVSSQAPDPVVEARAQIIWGESPETVLATLTAQGVSPATARSLVAKFTQERHDTLRQIALRRIVFGGLLVSIPLLYYFFVFHPHTGYSRLLNRGLVYSCALGLYGLWKFTNGLFAYLNPASQKGELSQLLD